MQNAWRVVDCTGLEGRITYVRGRISIHPKDADLPTEVPLAQTAVILLGLKASCSTAALYELAKYGVSVMLCDWRSVPISAMHSWSETHTYVTARHIAQAQMSLPRKKNAWARIVQSKIRGQAACLDSQHIDGGGLLRGIASQVRSGDPTNAEGHAAREYWKRVFPCDCDFRREPGSGLGRNAQLDYAYMILRGFAVKAVISAGLSPVFGVNHHGRGNYYCLADDLIEVYRPAIDLAVSKLDEDDELSDREVKHYLVEAVNQQFNDIGLTIPSSLNDFAQQFGLYCEKRIDHLEVPLFEGKS
ncbi:type II CRISPR-associated endonuclease Cas1 [Bifidobacterium oedipodis]|uniref:CRISPR-associated endonuclease Cas1 n=1 Tax=Bifidobacterium oedipodis TaxID=2675322 RepID=A0A7Y0HT73_9BIFI|nr:type II CRISPR-associated endonuclease Cas1 [Bifidobacterium sp. DSM 109957]NMM93812.1 type II CRISPR-associated endonuclease Cas1 [Bifidobacterium sp. DSM 109957]